MIQLLVEALVVLVRGCCSYMIIVGVVVGMMMFSKQILSIGLVLSFIILMSCQLLS